MTLSSRFRKYSPSLLALFLLWTLTLQAAPKPRTYPVSSPDGTTRLEIQVDGRKALVYRLLFAGEPVVDWSALGFNLNGTEAGQQVVVRKQSREQHNERFAWPLGENDSIRNQYHELRLDCRSGPVAFQLVARVYDGSVAFRYVLPGRKESPAGLLRAERTTFVLPEQYTIYQYNEESVFVPTPVADLQKTCDFPATLTNGRLYLSLGEADNRTYTKPVLTKGTAPHSLAVGFHKDSVRTGGDFQTPWRTISVATSAVGLHAFSDLPLRLAPANPAGVPAWVKPGKLIRSALTTQDGLNCIDFAARHDFQYILFDAGWYGAEFRSSSDPTQVIPAIDMPRVIQYGKEKGIGVILYVNRVGLRAKLDTILPLYKKWGVAGLKFGFVDGLTQEGLSWLIPAMQKVYDHGMILNIHDNYKPTGLSRTFPNLLTQEGIRGNENNPDAFHNTVLPFTRFVAGAADYTFCYPNANQPFSDNLRKTKLQVSKAQQLALTVVYFSPLQAMLWYGNPVDYQNEEELEYFKRVPTVWNETRYLAGDIGRFISVARRKGSRWFIGTAAGPADWSGPLTFDFLEAGKAYTATVYEDDEAGSIRRRTVPVKRGDSLPLRIRAKGGVAMVVE